MPVRTALVAFLAALALVGCGGGGGSSQPKQVRLALDFTPNAVHAGIYAAVTRGLDRKQGIHLVVRAPSASTDSLTLLATGRADLSIVDIHDLGLAREKGADLVGVGALVDRPLAAVIASSRIARPRELAGQRVGVTGLPSDNAVLRAVVEGDGGNYSRVETVTIGFSAVPSLIARRVEAVPAFWNAEGVVLKREGVPIREFRVDDYGAPRYPEVVLFTTRRTLEKRRAVVKAVVESVREGVRDVLRDPEPAVRDIARAGNSDEGLVRAQLRAVSPALRPPLVLRRKALEGWASWDARFGILKRKPDVDRAFDFGIAR
jgi:putative hydroxymethylpyrimidine transport system substrate-binding protein